MSASDESANSSSSALRRWLARVGADEAFEALSALLETDAVFAVDERRQVIHFNRAAERLLGFKAEEVVGQHCLTVNRCGNCRSGCGLAEHGRIFDVPLTLLRANNRPLSVRKSGRAFFDEQGQFNGGVEVLHPAQHATPPPQAPERQPTRFHGLLSRDPTLKGLFETARNVAQTDASVLIRGESGTGKELFARALHEESPRRNAPFIAVSCGALTPSLVESELFGHVRGAFTGAARDRVGLFEQARRGTLFLDEVAELPLDVQPKLLRALEAREVIPVGATRAVGLDVRIVAATHRSLREAVRQGRFREDLMYRLRVVPLFIPPLRKRPSDLEALLWHFIAQGNERGPRHIRAVAPQALAALRAHPFPGNVRELRNVVDHAFAISREPTLSLAELPPEFREPSLEAKEASGLPASVAGARTSFDESPPQPGGAGGTGAEPARRLPLYKRSAAEERELIQQALERHQGHLGRAAAELGISRPTLWRKRKKHNL